MIDLTLDDEIIEASKHPNFEEVGLKIVEEYKTYALNNHFTDPELLKIAANKFYTYAVYKEKLFPQKPIPELLKYFLHSSINHYYYHAYYFLSEYLIFQSEDIKRYEAAKECYDLCETFIDKTIDYLKKARPVGMPYEKTILKFSESDKLVLQTSISNYYSVINQLKGNYKDAYAYSIIEITQQEKVLEFTKKYFTSFDINREKANLLAKEIKSLSIKNKLKDQQVTNNQISEKDGTEESISIYLSIIEKNQEAYDLYPTSDKYKGSILDTINTLKEILNKNIKYWSDYIIKNGDNKTLIELMKKIDPDKYNAQKEKLDTKNDKIHVENVHGDIFINQNQTGDFNHNSTPLKEKNFFEKNIVAVITTIAAIVTILTYFGINYVTAPEKQENSKKPISKNVSPVTKPNDTESKESQKKPLSSPTTTYHKSQSKYGSYHNLAQKKDTTAKTQYIFNGPVNNSAVGNSATTNNYYGIKPRVLTDSTRLDIKTKMFDVMKKNGVTFKDTFLIYYSNDEESNNYANQISKLIYNLGARKISVLPNTDFSTNYGESKDYNIIREDGDNGGKPTIEIWINPQKRLHN